MISYSKVPDIFCLIDEFCKEYDQIVDKALLGNPSKRPITISKSEVIPITVLFHLGGFRCFKHFYIHYLQKHMQDEFSKTVSYNRFTERMQENLMPMVLFLKTGCLGHCTGISLIDSTPIRVCHNKRNKRNKVFKGMATTSKSTMGWFDGFKRPLMINDKGEILNFCITQANVEARKPVSEKSFIRKLYGKRYADNGYIDKKLVKGLFTDGIHLITQIKNNMKNSLMTLADKVLLRKRAIIETVNEELKNSCQIEHSRHRSFGNFLTNLISGLIAYSFLPKKPSIKYQTLNSNQIRLF